MNQRIDCEFSSSILNGNNGYVEGTVEYFINKTSQMPDFLLRVKNRPGRCLAMSNNHMPVKIGDKSYNNKELIEFLQSQPKENSR